MFPFYETFVFWPFGQSEMRKFSALTYFFLQSKPQNFLFLRQNWTKVEWLDEPEMEIYKNRNHLVSL